jgi:ribosomal protein S18 acetylase RimI-like enzyme
VRLDYREATERDVPALARIRANVRGTAEDWHEWISAYLRRERHPQHALDSRVVYVACDKGEVVGFVAGHLTRRYSCDGELQWIDVVDAYRRRGIASELVRRLASWFATQRASRICVDVNPDNVVAQHFYRRHGAQDLRPHWLVWPDITVVLRDGL